MRSGRPHSVGEAHGDGGRHRVADPGSRALPGPGPLWPQHPGGRSYFIFVKPHIDFTFVLVGFNRAPPLTAVFLLATELAGKVSLAGMAVRTWTARLVMLVTITGMGIWVSSTPGHQANWSIGSGASCGMSAARC
ncbi:MAG: hypothetical protein WBU92_08375 [Candidatus Dormiibacterota bacterium]